MYYEINNMCTIFSKFLEASLNSVVSAITLLYIPFTLYITHTAQFTDVCRSLWPKKYHTYLSSTQNLYKLYQNDLYWVCEIL